MTVNLSVKKGDEYALYVPAISSSYCHWVSQWEEKINCTDKDGKEKYKSRQNHKTLSPDAKELYFLDPNNGAFHYDAALYSAGHAQILDLNESQKVEKMVHSRNRKKTTIIADSGGYQIAKMASGSLLNQFDWNDPQGAQSDKIRMHILRWMESVADYSMMIDVPTFAIGNSKAMTSFADCLKLTQYNAEFIIKNREPGKTKILNVIQGRSNDESETWWQGVKDYPFEGWAFGGPTVRNIEILIRRLLIMREGKYLGGDRNWLHILGTSRLSSSCILTSIQRALRETVDKDFTISYDSATPFVCASKGFIYSQNLFDANTKNPRFSYLTHKFAECIEAYRMGHLPFPDFGSIPGRFLKLGDICCRDPKVSGTKTTWDSFSYVLLMWHNIYQQIAAIQQALRVYDTPGPQMKAFIPRDLGEFKDFCAEIFETENPDSLIKKHTRLLSNLTTGRENSGKKPSDLAGFNWDGEDADDTPDYEKIAAESDGRADEILQEFFEEAA